MVVTVEGLPRWRSREAARLLALAFRDDPGWLAIGPDRLTHRVAVERVYHRGAIAIARRFGCCYGAVLDEALAGVAITFRGEPPDLRSALALAPAFLLSGPAPMARALRVGRVMQRARPPEPHHYLWILGAHPGTQRRGVGRALMARAIADATGEGVPLYLETANPDNLPYYGSFGFEVTGEEALPRGARMWFMLRPLQGGASS